MDVMSRTHVGDPRPPELSLRYKTAEVQFDPDHKFTILQVTNPDPASGIALGPFLEGGKPEITGVGLTLSCQPDGTLQVRPAGAWAEYEAASIDAAGNVVFWPGQAFPNVPDMPKNQRGVAYMFLGAKNLPIVRP